MALRKKVKDETKIEQTEQAVEETKSCCGREECDKRRE